MRSRTALAIAAALIAIPAAAAAQPNPCAPKPGLRSHMLRVVRKEEPKPPTQPVATAQRPKPPTRPVAQAPKPPEPRCELPKAMAAIRPEELARRGVSTEGGNPPPIPLLASTAFLAPE